MDSIQTVQTPPLSAVRVVPCSAEQYSQIGKNRFGFQTNWIFQLTSHESRVYRLRCLCQWLLKSCANSGPTTSEKVRQMAQQAYTEYFPRGLSSPWLRPGLINRPETYTPMHPGHRRTQYTDRPQKFMPQKHRLQTYRSQTDKLQTYRSWTHMPQTHRPQVLPGPLTAGFSKHRPSGPMLSIS